jgi:hypothetical protein
MTDEFQGVSIAPLTTSTYTSCSVEMEVLVRAKGLWKCTYISLSQRQYIEEIVHTFSFHKENKVYTQMEPHSTPRKFLESEDEEFDIRLYLQLIGIFM